LRFFSDQRELVQYARKFVLARVDSLENDAKRCYCNDTTTAHAPFPALLYCFSTVDLLGALYCGNATKDNPNLSKQPREYMQRFMNYTSEQTNLLQSLFRHKLVHLAQPKAVIKKGSKYISWYSYKENPEKHLVLEELAEEQTLPITSSRTIKYNCVFHVGVLDFVKDIRTSVEKATGYLTLLETTPDIQDKFEQAITQIYDYE
jgi:hypothetical protein